MKLVEDVRESSRFAGALDETEERTRRRIPVPHDTGLVEQHHGLADVRECARGIGALLRCAPRRAPFPTQLN